MVDFHSHIMPKIDDGADSVETALKMLKGDAEAGVTDILSTSHCYPHTNDSILRFLGRRDKAYAMLKEGMAADGGEFPKIHIGCEVNVTTFITKFKSIGELRIADTDYILIEMPFDPWKNWMIEEVYNLTVLGLKPIMAHIDRFLTQAPEMLKALYELDVLYQVNTDLFLTKRMSKYARKLFEEGHIQFLGTDMHNMSTRKPNIAQAREKIEAEFGEACMPFFAANGRAVLYGDGEVEPFVSVTPKRSAFAKFFMKK